MLYATHSRVGRGILVFSIPKKTLRFHRITKPLHFKWHNLLCLKSHKILRNIIKCLQVTVNYPGARAN